MVNKEYVNNNGQVYRLFDEIERNQKDARIKAAELRNDGFNALLRHKISWYHDTIYYVYFRERDETYIKGNPNFYPKIEV